MGPTPEQKWRKCGDKQVNDERIAMYDRGAITAHQFAVEVLHMLDPGAPDLVLSHLPIEIYVAIQQLSASYDPREMRTNYGVVPAEDQVAKAIEWIRKNYESIAEEAVHPVK